MHNEPLKHQMHQGCLLPSASIVSDMQKPHTLRVSLSFLVARSQPGKSKSKHSKRQRNKRNESSYERSLLSCIPVITINSGYVLSLTWQTGKKKKIAKKKTVQMGAKQVESRTKCIFNE